MELSHANPLFYIKDDLSRPIQQGIIVFSIQKALIRKWLFLITFNITSIFVFGKEPTYTWEYQEMVDFLTNKIKNEVDSGLFYTKILEEIVST